MDTAPHGTGTTEESDGYRIEYQPLNGSGKTRITVTEVISGRQAIEIIRPNAIGGGTQSVRDALIRSLQRGECTPRAFGLLE
ncbi:MAG: hypothetical protein Q7S29_04070 [Candidatus Peribacter sp.]|nr:hypothetical protein [Candidatus Peribacter sp.]